MKALNFLLFLVLNSIFTHSFAETSVRSCRSYELSSSNNFGSFSGFLNIYSDGFAERWVEYSNKSENGLRIEELWQGRVQSEFEAQFPLNQNRFISKLGENKLPKNAFENERLETINFQNLKVLAFCKNVDDPTSKRKKIEIKPGRSNPVVVQIAKSLLLRNILKWYESQPELNPYRNNPDFIANRFFLIQDFTDLEFYRGSLDRLRVRNAYASEFTIAEAFLRRSAYAYTLEQKAEIFDRETKAFNINRFGLFQDFAGGFGIPNYDSALWTGMYVASQAARYQATLDPIALENVRESLRGLLLLVKIMNEEGQNTFARSLIPNDGSSQSHPNSVLAKSSSIKISYIPGANNDMLKGLILGMAMAYKVLPAKDPLVSEMAEVISDLKNVKLKRMQGLNQVYLFGLDAILNHSTDSYQKFLRAYLQNQNLLNLIGLDAQFFIEGMADWSGVNLSAVSVASFFAISNELIKIWPEDEGLASGSQGEVQGLKTVNVNWILQQQRRTLKRLQEMFSMTKRDNLCLMYKTVFDSQIDPPNECLQAMIETPVEYPSQKVTVDHSTQADFVLSKRPWLPWKSFKQRQSVQYHMMANSIYPIFETAALNSPMYWAESPFQFQNEKRENAKLARVDFIFSYWLSKSNLLSK